MMLGVASRQSTRYRALVGGGAKAVKGWSALSRNEQMRAHAFFCNLMVRYQGIMRQIYLADSAFDRPVA